MTQIRFPGFGKPGIGEVPESWMKIKLKLLSKSWVSLSQGSTFTCLNRDDIANLSITIPEIAEQKRVGEILEKVDHELKTLASAKAYYKSQRLGLMTLLFE